MHFTFSTIAVAVLAMSVTAHPGHDHEAEMAERAKYTKFSKRDLSHCTEKINARGIEQRAIARRAATARSAMEKRGLNPDALPLRPRASSTPLDTDHESSTDYTANTEESVIFASNSSCILSPEVTQGPYWVEGEYVRKNVTETQAGVHLTLDAQILDVNTCDPITNAVLEIWNCNSTGVYSGIIASGNGVGESDPTNLNNTFLRGLQPTDDDGVAQFETLIPGHYSGRATHTHVMVHFNGTLFENGTYSGGYISHVGQLFYDQDLITKVSAVEPYSSNTQAVTLNSEDSILAEEMGNGHDPFVEYSLLGESVSDGVFAWISFGVDTTVQESLDGAATLTGSGGVTNANSGMGGGAPPGSGNGTMGNGTAPMGSAPGANATSASGTGSATGSSVLATVSAAAGEIVKTASSGLVVLLGFFLGLF